MARRKKADNFIYCLRWKTTTTVSILFTTNIYYIIEFVWCFSLHILFNTVLSHYFFLPLLRSFVCLFFCRRRLFLLCSLSLCLCLSLCHFVSRWWSLAVVVFSFLPIPFEVCMQVCVCECVCYSCAFIHVYAYFTFLLLPHACYHSMQFHYIMKMNEVNNGRTKQSIFASEDRPEMVFIIISRVIINGCKILDPDWTLSKHVQHHRKIHWGDTNTNMWTLT